MLSPRLQAPANGQEAMERLEKGTLQMKVAKDLRRRQLRGKSRILSDLQKQMEDKRKQELHEEHQRREEAHAQERAATEATRARLRAEALSRMRHARPNTRRGGLSPRPQYGPPGLLLPAKRSETVQRGRCSLPASPLARAVSWAPCHTAARRVARLVAARLCLAVCKASRSST